jgi:hypothetical protein
MERMIFEEITIGKEPIRLEHRRVPIDRARSRSACLGRCRLSHALPAAHRRAGAGKRLLRFAELVSRGTQYGCYGAAGHRVRGRSPALRGLQKKFMNARNFEQAFELRNKKRVTSQPKFKKRKSNGEGFELREFAWDLINMGKDHEYSAHAFN